tara:strand:- start:530 stop:904 length:375 start_codon:yes stop_codon:yes gene_type:complete
MNNDKHLTIDSMREQIEHLKKDILNLQISNVALKAKNEGLSEKMKKNAKTINEQTRLIDLLKDKQNKNVKLEKNYIDKINNMNNYYKDELDYYKKKVRIAIFELQRNVARQQDGIQKLLKKRNK